MPTPRYIPIVVKSKSNNDVKLETPYFTPLVIVPTGF